MDYEHDCDSNCSQGAWNGTQQPGKMTERIGNQKKNRDHPD